MAKFGIEVWVVFKNIYFIMISYVTHFIRENAASFDGDHTTN